jgi:hypothetical protein
MLHVKEQRLDAFLEEHFRTGSNIETAGDLLFLQRETGN